MKSILVDAGPLIALFDKNDSHHAKAVDFLRDFNGILVSTWPVITEVSHMLDFSINTQINFLKWIERGGLEIFDLEFKHVLRLIELSEKFSDVPMDLADASLIVAGEQKLLTEIATLDSDFYVYRNVRNEYLKNIFIK